VARELALQGYDVLCPVREPDHSAARELTAAIAGSARVRCLQADVTDREQLFQALDNAGADALISCIASRNGGPEDSERVDHQANLNLLEWAGSRDVRHFTLLSAICVQKPRLAFQFAKLRFEHALAKSGLDYSIVRPTAFMKSLSGQLSRVRAGKPFLQFGDGQLTRCKPIAEADLARFIVSTVENREMRGILPVGGPGPALSPRDQVDILERLLAHRIRTRSVPPMLLQAVAAALSLPAIVSSSADDKREFARIGHYYATESMLVWDHEGTCYSDEATPEFGDTSLEDSYRAQLEGRESQALGAQAMFK
jgi:divinyl chlorophyllide a 8-vinyl-reductase